MHAEPRERLVLEPIADDPEVGRWLAALEDGRRDTLRELERVTPELVDDPPELAALLPWPDRDANGQLWRVDGLALTAHVERLAGVREFVLTRLRPMTNDEFHRVRALERYDVAPDWAVHHIIQHEAEHRSHIAWLRDTAAREDRQVS